MSGLLSGCTGGLPPYGMPSAASSDAALCASVGDLKTAIKGLENLDLGKDGTAAVSEALKGVRTDIEQVIREAQDRYRPQVNDVKAGLKAVDTAVQDAVQNPTAATLSAAATQLGSLGTDVGALVKEVDSSC